MDTQAQFIEDMGVYFERIGMTRMAGRIVGYLLICDPELQTMPDMIAELAASKSAVSTALSQLGQAGLVDRISLPNERRDHFRINADIWTQTFAGRQQLVTDLRQLAERGLALLSDAPEDTRQRLRIMYELNAFMEQEMPRLLDRWQAYKREKGL